MSGYLAEQVREASQGALAAQRAVDQVRNGADPRDVVVALPAELSHAWVAAALRELLKAAR
jgi:hypothetical protein